MTGTTGASHGNAAAFSWGTSQSIARDAARRARRGVDAVGPATDKLISAVDHLDDLAVRGPSRLPGWSRAHVISHLARNADGLVNLLTWARTGVEHPMYTSKADRDADVAEGATRPHQVLAEDLAAASQRFAHAAETLVDAAWTAKVCDLKGNTFAAAEVPWRRLREVWLHLIDLDVGVGVDAVPSDIIEDLLDDAVRQFSGRQDVPPLVVHAELPNGHQRSWVLSNSEQNSAASSVRGSGKDMLAWLTGRGTGAGLTGTLPSLPAWT